MNDLFELLFSVVHLIVICIFNQLILFYNCVIFNVYSITL